MFFLPSPSFYMKLRFFEIAKRMADYSDHPEHVHGAVVVKRGRCIGYGFNSLKTHTKSNSYNKTKHAEFSAILNSKQQDFSGCELYVVRVNKRDEFANSKPCRFCMQLIKSLGFDRIHYSTDSYFETEEVA